MIGGREWLDPAGSMLYPAGEGFESLKGVFTTQRFAMPYHCFDPSLPLWPQVIGEGAFSKVHLGRWRGLDVAVKVRWMLR